MSVDIYSSNLSLLKTKNPSLAIKIENEEIDNSYHFFQSKSGSLTVEKLQNNNRILLHSSYNPHKEAKNLISEYNFDDIGLVIVFGFGGGYHIEELIDKLKEDIWIWIFEADLKLLKTCMMHRDLSKIFRRNKLQFFSAKEIYQFKISLSYQLHLIFFPRFPRFHNISFILHPVLYNQDKNIYDYISKTIRDDIIKISSGFIADVEEGPKWFFNTLSSIEIILKSQDIKTLYNRWCDKPAIIVCAGPSLDKNIDDLKLVQDKAVIISVGTALKPLLKKGIKPHLVCIVDANPLVYTHIEGLEDLDIPIVVDPMVYSKVMTDYKGPKFIAGVMFGWEKNPIFTVIEEYFGEFGRPGGAFSVATLAFSLAAKLGAKPIILIGQDLSYPNDGRTHASESVYSHWKVDFTRGNYIKAKGNLGDEVYTIQPFIATASWYEDNIIANPNLKVINATEGGIYIEGTQVMKLSDAIEKYCKDEYNAKEIFENLESERKIKRKILKKLKQEFQNIIKDVEKLNKFACQGLEYSKRITNIFCYEKEKIQEQRELQDKLQKICNDIKKEDRIMSILYTLLRPALMFITKEEVETLDVIGETEDEKRIARELTKAGVLCESIKNTTEEALPSIKEALEKIENILKR